MNKDEIKDLIIETSGSMGNFAKDVGKSPVELSHIVSGRRKADEETITKMSKKLGVHEEKLRDYFRKISEGTHTIEQNAAKHIQEIKSLLNQVNAKSKKLANDLNTLTSKYSYLVEAESKKADPVLKPKSK